MIFGRERGQIRRLFIDTWRKHLEGAPLAPLERSIAAVIEAHPEYHSVMSDPAAIIQEYAIDDDAGSNPFLHMGLHISIIEQISSDRPEGVRVIYDRLRRRFADSHDLEHAMMRCLAETLEDGRARGEPPDERKYLHCLRRLESRVP